MNHIINDYGQTVIAVGAPNSPERLKIIHPKLMSLLSSLYWQAHSYNPPGRYIEDAVKYFEDFGIMNATDRNNIISALEFPVEFWKF